MKSTLPTIDIWDEVAKTYELEINAAEIGLAAEIKRYIQKYEVLPGSKLVELGSGSGHLSAILAQEGYDVTLLDFSPVALEKAKSTFHELGLRGTFINGDLLGDLSFLGDEYDLAWNSGVMEHFDESNLSRAFQSISKIKAKYYLFVVPNPNSIPYLLFRYKTMANGEWVWGKEFLRKNYSSLLFENGFTVINEGYLGASFSEQHLKYVLGEDFELPFKELVDYGLISSMENYLKVFVAMRTNEDLQTNNLEQENEKIDIDQLKTEIFDLSCQINQWKNLYKKLIDTENKWKIENEKLNQDVVSIKNEKSELESFFYLSKGTLEKQLKEKEQELLEITEANKKRIERLESSLRELQVEKKDLSKEFNNRVIQLEAEKEQVLKESSNQSDYLTNSFYERMNNIQDQINKIANTKPYRLAYFIRRLKHQFIKGTRIQKKDFIKWNLNKLRGKPAQPNLEYNLLFKVSSELNNFCFNNPINNNKQQEVDFLRSSLKTKKSVFIFATVPYYDIGGGQRSAQLAKTFDRMGYLVNYIYAYEATDGSNNQNIFIPAVIHRHVDKFTNQDIIDRLSEDNIFIFEAPIVKFESYLRTAKNYKIPVVYEHIDNWETSLGDMFFTENSFRNFINNSDRIIATSQLLQEKILNFISRDNGISNKETQVIYLPNAVDSELFEQLITHEKPDDLVFGEKTILYYGSLWGEWFDWDLVSYIAQKRPQYEINLIGDCDGLESIQQTMPRNVHFLGLKKQSELPGYLQHSDVAIIPFKNDDIGKYVSPLKVFEYICMGKKVVSTSLPEITGYPNVYDSDSKEKWIEYLDKNEEIVNFNTFVLQNNWYSRCRDIIDITKQPPKDQTISIIILNRNNKKTIIKCVESLLLFNTYNYEIIVVDNQSTDGSYEFLQEEYGDHIKLVKNTKNGCSSGRNLGVQNSKGELIFFLDSDQWIIEKNWLDDALEILKTRRDIGAVGWNAGWFDENSVEGPIVDYYPNRAIKPNELFRTDVTYLATSGLLMAKLLFEEIGGFDEYYDPTCFEDTDLSLMIRNKGYKLAYCPYMSIFHLPHQTTNSGSVEHKKRMIRNGEYFLNKWKAIDGNLLK